MQIVINLPKYVVGLCCEDNVTDPVDIATLIHAIKAGVPIPEGHGDLIDRNKIECLKAIHNAKFGHITWSDAIKKIKYSATTIVEADSESEG